MDASSNREGQLCPLIAHIPYPADKAKGAIKDAAGKVTGDMKLQSEGKIDKAKGDAHNAAGNVKDAVKDLTK